MHVHSAQSSIATHLQDLDATLELGCLVVIARFTGRRRVCKLLDLALSDGELLAQLIDLVVPLL